MLSLRILSLWILIFVVVEPAAEEAVVVPAIRFDSEAVIAEAEGVYFETVGVPGLFDLEAACCC